MTTPPLLPSSSTAGPVRPGCAGSTPGRLPVPRRPSCSFRTRAAAPPTTTRSPRPGPLRRGARRPVPRAPGAHRRAGTGQHRRDGRRAAGSSDAVAGKAVGAVRAQHGRTHRLRGDAPPGARRHAPARSDRVRATLPADRALRGRPPAGRRRADRPGQRTRGHRRQTPGRSGLPRADPAGAARRLPRRRDASTRARTGAAHPGERVDRRVRPRVGVPRPWPGGR